MGDSLIQFKGTIFERGYGQVAKVVMQDENLSKISKLLYAYICTFGNGAFPSREKICSDLKIGKNSISSSLSELVKNGYITIQQQRKENGHFYNNVYVIELIKK
ncbi:MAG: hypothetical protein H6Q70_2074 [Firmicutes bacterium]|nr:hypothetical protein [Bacillota bacterium]